MCERVMGGGWGVVQRGGVKAGEGKRSTEETPGYKAKDKLAATPLNRVLMWREATGCSLTTGT